MALRTILLGLAAAALAALASAPHALAQCRLCDTPTTSRNNETDSGEIRIEVETSLDFDRLVVDGEGEGSAIIRPDGSNFAAGSVTEIGPRAMVGTVVLRGEPGRTVRVELPRRIILYSLSGGQVVFEDVLSDLPSLPRLDSNGVLTFRFGGRLRVSGNSEGDYSGELPIIAEYL
ncbi:MAG TPA: DUF4402 domain-containing protein [Sphingomicrobium sp.]|nr:DUF4402 domain-containing protein [Sphingomicrobium sp.]